MGDMTKNLAIIDDDPDMEDVYTLLLGPLIETGKVKVDFFTQPEIFLESFGLLSPHHIFCDIHMPGIDGVELCRRLRLDGHNVPITFVSGHAPQDYVDVMSELGIRHFLSKPLCPDRMQGCLEEAIAPSLS